MDLTYYLIFFISLTSCCFTSALKCYKCEEKNPDATLINGFCSRSYNKNSWEIVECSGSCFSGSEPHPYLQGKRVGQRFVNPTYFSNIIFLTIITAFLKYKTNFEVIDFSKIYDQAFLKNLIIHFS